jgi:hypothetical protein
MSVLLAIDPGDKQSAYVVWDGAEIHEKGILPNPEMLSAIPQLRECCDDCAIEMIASYGMAVGATVFETCVWVGRFWQEWGEDAFRVYRKDVKMHLCQSMRAKDANIRQALIDRLGEPGTKASPGVTYGVSKDVWAALAVAVTAYDKWLREELKK